MNILSIGTSCDETAVSVMQAEGEFPHATYTLLGNALFSQIDLHREYGGVFPNLAKREHIKTVLPMLEKAFSATELLTNAATNVSKEQKETLYELLYREEGLADALIAFHEKHGIPAIDLIAVTSGPGLEPALWVGLNFAKALAYLWNVPLVPVNHMEGHVLASVFDGARLAELAFPALALLISGGHTELILMREWGVYERIGETRDDAVGEAFDKVARMMGLPYPGGPEIGKLAKVAREAGLPQYAKLPRPMIDTNDYDFSFSGLKTAVRYAIEGEALSDAEKQALSRDFEDAVAEVLKAKVARAIGQLGIQSFILGGGVAANEYIRTMFTTSTFTAEYPDLAVYLPERSLSTDNSVMIALAGHERAHDAYTAATAMGLRADGNRSLADS